MPPNSAEFEEKNITGLELILNKSCRFAYGVRWWWVFSSYVAFVFPFQTWNNIQNSTEVYKRSFNLFFFNLNDKDIVMHGKNTLSLRFDKWKYKIEKKVIISNFDKKISSIVQCFVLSPCNTLFHKIRKLNCKFKWKNYCFQHFHTLVF